MGVRHFQDEGDSFACFGRPPLIAEAVEGAPLTGQLPSAQSGEKLNNSFIILVLNIIFQSPFPPQKMPGHVKLGATGEPDPGLPVENNLKQKIKLLINNFRSTPLPCRQQCHKEVISSFVYQPFTFNIYSLCSTYYI